MLCSRNLAYLAYLAYLTYLALLAIGPLTGRHSPRLEPARKGIGSVPTNGAEARLSARPPPGTVPTPVFDGDSVLVPPAGRFGSMHA